MTATDRAEHTRRISAHLEGGAGAAGTGTVPAGRLMRMLVAMKWTLWRRSFRKNVGKTIGTIVGALYGIGGMVGLAVALGSAALFLPGGGSDVFGLLLRGLGAVLVLVWLLLPLFAFGLDETLDARRFAALPRSARELQPGLFAAAAVSLPTLFTVVGVLVASVCEVLWLVTGSGLASGASIGAIVLMVPANLLGIVLCLLLPRAIISHAATRQSSRRGRELGGVLAAVLGLGAMYGFSLAMQGIGGLDPLALIRGPGRAVVSVLAWTPLGALFSVPLDVAESHWLVALARLVIGVAAIVLLWLWWRRSLGIALRSALVGDATSGSASTAPLVPRFVRADAAGASMGRSLRYWRRDSRYMASVVVLPLMLVFFVAMGLISPAQRPMTLLLTVFVCGLTGTAVMNELGYDGPAGWVNITAGVPARANLVGRLRAAACVEGPLVVIAGAVVPLVLGYADLVPMILLGGIGAMMSGLGVALLIGMILPFPTPEPGTNPMRTRGGGSANSMLAVGIGMIGIWVPQIPALALAFTGIALDSTVLEIGAGVLATVLGAVTLLVTVHVASGILSRRYVDVFQKVRAFL